MLKEVVAFTIGDSAKVSTWSGIPYFFTSSLEELEIKVNRVNLAPPAWMRYFYQKILSKIYKVICRYSINSIYLTAMYRWWAMRVIKRKTMLYPTSEISIFFTYSFLDLWGDRPNILICDWSLQYYIEKRLNRKPSTFETKCILRENEVIKKANLVLSLFPQCANYLQSHIDGNIVHLGVNVVNNYKKEPDPNIVLQKKNNLKILFIGREHYIEGYRMLIKAFDTISGEIPNCQLDVIGLSNDKNISFHPAITHHGYLRKEVEKECSLYYKLLSEASIIVNVNPNWAGYSSIIEAMYYYTPIIISPFECFVEEFGRNLSCGFYCNDSDQLPHLIKEIFFHSDYETLCYSAHKLVETHTWTNFIEEFINQVEKSIVSR